MCCARARGAAHSARSKTISSGQPAINSPEIKSARAAAMKFILDGQLSGPPDVLSALLLGLVTMDKIEDFQNSNLRSQTQMLRALGITPSTEQRGSSGKPLDPNQPRGVKAKPVDPIAHLRQVQERYETLSQWQQQSSQKNAERAEKTKMKREKLESKMAEEGENQDAGAEDETSVEETVEQAAAREADNVAMRERAASGGGADPAMMDHPETLMAGSCTTLRVEEIEHAVDRDTLARSAIVNQTFSEQRVRIDFSLMLTKIIVNVEKLAISAKAGDTLVSADMDSFGPPKMLVTWRFLVSTAILASQYVLPFNRIAKMTSSSEKKFTASEISRYYGWVAECFVEVYIRLGQSLAHADILAGDDTGTLVLEVASSHMKMAEGIIEAPPWSDYASKELAKKVDGPRANTMAVRLACAFGFAAQRKNGSGTKIQFNTTTLSGRTDPANPYSMVVFYRSHLGGFGNLLDIILPSREAKDGDLIVQSDLSTVNLISENTLAASCQVRLAGCSSHARRPFAIYEKQDPEVCDWILHAFKAIPIFEGYAASFGRNKTNVGAVRDIDQRKNWEFIREQCEELIKIWSKATPLGDAARYILRHYDKLTLYLTVPMLAPSNNFSERMLRQEKLISNNSLFRKSLEGRCSLDIMRTVFQTCVAAGVDPSEYCTWVMREDRAVVAGSPEEYTPLAYKTMRAGELAEQHLAADATDCTVDTSAA